MECSQEHKDQLRRATSLLKLVPPKRPRQCEHIKSNGEFCGSPALRGRNYCYFHLTHIGRRLRAERSQARAQAGPAANAVVELKLPPFEDANSIQIALMQVVDALLNNRIDSKRAGLVLYALQTASSNLANGAGFAPHSAARVAGRYDAFEQDYELGDAVPELQADEAAEAQADEEYATAAQMERIIETCNEFQEAKKKAAEYFQIETKEDGTEIFVCSPQYRLLCDLMGPMAHGRAPGGPRQCELDAASQRLELLPSLFAPDEGEENGAAGDAEELAA
ncbi:MAG TPA: hypothetical protein VLV47_01545 [Candidatus Bathyarchaeia archaeon]|nr:hypothetical protein [Candidatus Bathyarchaeia archaeon]